MAKKQTVIAPAHKAHKFNRIEPKTEGKSATYRCILPGCNYSIREEFMIGKVAVCTRCEEEFIVTKAIFFPRKQRKVHCIPCNRPTFNKKLGKVTKVHGPEGVNEAAVTSLLDDLLNPKDK